MVINLLERTINKSEVIDLSDDLVDPIGEESVKRLKTSHVVEQGGPFAMPEVDNNSLIWWIFRFHLGDFSPKRIKLVL